MDTPANSIFSGPITSVFSAMHFDESPFTCQRQKEDKKAQAFQISHFYGSFSNDIMAAKGLSMKLYCWQGAALLGGVNALHTAFPENAEDEYSLQGNSPLC